MTADEILLQVTQVFKDVLDNDSIQLSYSTTAPDVDGWDSLTHIQLVVGVEKHFKIRFTSLEIQGWKNVGAMINNIESKLNLQNG